MGIKPSGIFLKPIFLSWILIFINLSLILKSGLYSDDIMTYQMRSSMGPISFLHLTDIIQKGITESIQSGRFTPISFVLEGLLMWVSGTVLIYKVYLFLINLLAVFAFSRMLRSLDVEGWIPLALLGFSSAAQFYVHYHDPFTALHAMYPLLAILVFSTITFFIQYLKSGKLIMLFMSMLALILAILNSEIGFVIYPVLLVLLIYDDSRSHRKVTAFLPFAIALAIYAAIFIVIRANTHSLYNGVEADLTPAKVLRGFFFQLVAALPLLGFSYMPFIWGFLYHAFLKTYPFVILSVLAFSSLLISIMSLPHRALDRTKRNTVLWIGLILWVMPACILMVSKKYQGELDFGRGYLPVYIQDFGVSLLMVVLFDFLLMKFQERRKVILSIGYTFVFVVSLMTFLRNDMLIDQANFNRAIPSTFYYKSLKNGILKDCEDGSVIVLRTDYYWHAPFCYQVVIDNFYKKGFQVIAEDSFKGLSTGEKGHFYMLEHNNVDQLTRLSRIRPDETIEIKRISYPASSGFSYFDLISKPL